MAEKRTNSSVRTSRGARILGQLRCWVRDRRWNPRFVVHLSCIETGRIATDDNVLLRRSGGGVRLSHHPVQHLRDLYLQLLRVRRGWLRRWFGRPRLRPVDIIIRLLHPEIENKQIIKSVSHLEHSWGNKKEVREGNETYQLLANGSVGGRRRRDWCRRRCQPHRRGRSLAVNLLRSDSATGNRALRRPFSWSWKYTT